MTLFREEYKLGGRLVILRSAEPKDAAELIAFVRRVDGETPFLSREPGEFVLTEEEERGYIARCLDMPNRRFAVAEADGRVVGFCDTRFGLQRRYRHAGEAVIAVEKARWGMGVGRALLASGIEWLRQNGVTKVNSLVDTKNQRALSLYLRQGFVVEGTRTAERRLGDGTYRDAYYMGRRLD